MDHAPTGRDRDPGYYEIRVEGHLDHWWTAWFDGMTLASSGDGTTAIWGPVADQAALHGLLQRLRDTGLPLVSVRRVPPGSPSLTTHLRWTTDPRETPP